MATDKRVIRWAMTTLLKAFASFASLAIAGAFATAAAPSTRGEAAEPGNAMGRSQAVEVVRLAANSLIARSTPMPRGGWAWRSSIQAPHFHTDRDVGAASVGAGLLAAHAITGDKRYLRGAVKAGDYLRGVGETTSGGGLRWPDWADPDGERSETHYTSFDDGAAGISDFLWRLFKATHQPRFRVAAVAGMRWIVSRAEAAPAERCPGTCTWKWTDDPSARVAYHGVGMGQAGIVWALDVFADRTNDPVFRTYARAGAARLRLLTENGKRPLPEQAGTEAYGTGFLSGSAGAAAVLLQRFVRDRNRADLATAHGLLEWVNRQAISDRSRGLRWPIVVSSDAVEDTSAAGFEEGVAGIAWVNLRAYLATGRAEFRDVARRAAVWLRSVATTEGGGSAWAEQPGVSRSPVHVGLDSGAAGIGWVLDELALAGIDPAANREAAWSALGWLDAEARRDRLGAFWFENTTAGRSNLRAEPSWHWGSAGIAAFAARLAGHERFGPGGQPLHP